MTRNSACFIALLILSFLAPGARISSSTTPKHEVTVERMIVAPASYERMFDSSEVVARVRILNSHATVVDRAGGLPGAITEYTAQVVDVIKGSYKPADTIRFVQQAGRAENQDTIVTVLGAQPLSTAGEYVVFLKSYPYLRTLIITNDPEGAYEIRDGKIKPAGASRISNQRRDMPASEFLRELNHVAQQRGYPR